MSKQREDFDSEIERLSFELAQTNRRITEMSERIDQLEYALDELVTDLPTQTKSKREKKGAILKKALDASEDNSHIAFINQDMASGAADCTKRHTRTLFQELDETYAWAEYNPDRRPAALEIDFDRETVGVAREKLAEQFPVFGDWDG